MISEVFHSCIIAVPGTKPATFFVGAKEYFWREGQLHDVNDSYWSDVCYQSINHQSINQSVNFYSGL